MGIDRTPPAVDSGGAVVEAEGGLAEEWTALVADADGADVLYSEVTADGGAPDDGAAGGPLTGGTPVSAGGSPV